MCHGGQAGWRTCMRCAHAHGTRAPPRRLSSLLPGPSQFHALSGTQFARDATLSQRSRPERLFIELALTWQLDRQHAPRSVAGRRRRRWSASGEVDRGSSEEWPRRRANASLANSSVSPTPPLTLHSTPQACTQIVQVMVMQFLSIIGGDKKEERCMRGMVCAWRQGAMSTSRQPGGASHTP